MSRYLIGAAIGLSLGQDGDALTVTIAATVLLIVAIAATYWELKRGQL